jgi:hypothetical protein
MSRFDLYRAPDSLVVRRRGVPPLRLVSWLLLAAALALWVYLLINR